MPSRPSDSTKNRLVSIIADDPGCNADDLALITKLRVNSVRAALLELQAAGRVEWDEHGAIFLSVEGFDSLFARPDRDETREDVADGCMSHPGGVMCVNCRA